MDDALERLLPVLVLTTGGRKIVADAAGVSVPVKTASALVILINELVTNAAKHGQGDIALRLSLEGETVILKVSDSGPGFPPGFDPDSGAHIGLDLVESVGRWDLKGEIDYSNRPEGGAVVTVTFPLPSVIESYLREDNG
jgi:two-component sensor histidine kinase